MSSASSAPVRTRFAPSPTGYLHIGGARTALFAWAYAQQQGGEFFLRIEDTDAKRSDAAHSCAIIAALDWLNLERSGETVFQSARQARHQEVVRQLLQEGRAYHCYASTEELAALRAAQLARGESPRYDRRWRDATATPPRGVPPVVRFKMPLQGETAFTDLVKGRLAVANDTLDDFVLARADGAPTYNLAAVVDDVDMGITHIIRGDDHVMNTYRQHHIFAALAPQMPQFAHLPMILTQSYDEDGKAEQDARGNARYVRMSKRHAAADIAIYRRQGYLPQALCNYLSRLSWAHGDAELFSRDFFVENFSLSAVSPAPARFDMDKLKWLNRAYLHNLSPAALRQVAGIADSVSDDALALIRNRDTLQDISNEAAYFAQRPVHRTALAAEEKAALRILHAALDALPAADWNAAGVKSCIKQTAAAQGGSFKQFGMPLRTALTGRATSPDIAAIAAILGREEVLARIHALCGAD